MRIYVCIMYVCMFVLIGAPMLIGALIGALCAVDVSQVKYARIENVCIYRRADILGVLYVCMHAYT